MKESPLAQLELLKSAAEATQTGVTIARAGQPDRPLIYVNPAFLRLTGYAADEVLGRDCRFLQAGITEQPGLDKLRAAFAEGKQVTVLLRNRRKDGTEFLNELTMSPVRAENGEVTHFIGIQHDVTEREEAIARANALAESLQRQAAVLELANRELDAFSYSVSHDLRAPLDVVGGFAKASIEQLDAGNIMRAKHCLERILLNAEKMSGLIQALLELSQLSGQSLRLQACDVTAMAQEVISELRAAEPHRAVEVHIATGLSARADPTLLRCLLQNLIGNAWKYSVNNAGALIQVGRESTPPNEFFVRDNGAGFDMEQAVRLFGAFQRFHSANEFPGTGIGLATVRRIILRHGGTIRAMSRRGLGAVFYFTLVPERPLPSQPRAEKLLPLPSDVLGRLRTGQSE